MAFSPSFHQLLQRHRPAVLAILCTACLLLAWWVVQRADADMRQSLLQQAQLVARSLDHGHIATLTGRKSDLATPSYRKIKEQLAAAGAVHPQYRLVYLMDRSAEGRVVFLADGEPFDSPDHAPPGTVFEEATAAFLRVFDARIPVVEGPVADSRGTRIAALIPLIDPGSGRATVLGLDVDARAWALEVAARSALPIGLMLVLLILASRLLVYGAVFIAQSLGVSDLIIGLTVVAVGTSLPELASSLIAIKKGEHDIALGNVIGSNLFNTLAVVGIAAAIEPMAVEAVVLTRDWTLMAVLTAAIFVMGYGYKKQGRINRVEGALLLAIFIGYTGYLISTVLS